MVAERATKSLGTGLMDLIFGGSYLQNSITPVVEMPPAMSAQMAAVVGQERAWNINSWDASTALYGQEPTALTSEECRSIARMSLIAPLVMTRVRKWKACGHPQMERGGVGYVVGTRDPKAKNTKALQKEIAHVRGVLEEGSPFAIKMEKWGRDGTEIDRGIGQVLFDEKPRSPTYGKPVAITAEDGATFRWAMPNDKDRARGRINFDTQPVVQWVWGRPVSALARQQVIWIQQNNRTDIGVQGYGYSVIEMAARVIDSLWKADEFNNRFFENGVHAAFLLKVKAQMGPEMWESLQRQITDKLRGVRNSHKFAAILLRPGQQGITAPEDIEKIDLAGSPKDMEFRWAYGFYYRVLAAIMGIDLNEAGLDDPADTGKSTLQEANTEWKVNASHASGLLPGLMAAQMELNTRVIWPLNEDLILRFEGLAAMSPQEQANMDEQQGRFLRPLNEVRALANLGNIAWTYKKPEDECPIQYAQLYLQMAQMKMQQEQFDKTMAANAAAQPQADAEPSIHDFGDVDDAGGGDSANAQAAHAAPLQQWHREPGPRPGKKPGMPQ